MTRTEHVGKNAPLDLAKLEADVTAAIPARSLIPINSAPPVQSDPMPNYVERQDGVPRVGALSAEAMVRDHESAAKEIEAMGAELISAAVKCEAMTAEVHNAIAYMREIAAAYRKEAKNIFKRIAADAQIKRTRSEIEALLVDYAIKARELAMLADEHA